MNYRFVFFLILIASFLFTPGCGTKSSEVSEDSSEKKPYISSQEETLYSAAKACDDFLDALIHGDDEKLRNLMTPLARKKNVDLGIPLSSSNSSNARYEILETTLFNQDGAYVRSILSDVDDQDKRESAEIVWIVAKTSEGWRVAGAAVSLFGERDKTVLNFEDPQAAQNAIAKAEIQEFERQKKNSAR